MLSDEINEFLLADTALAQWTYTQLGMFRDQTVGPFTKVENYNKQIFELVIEGWKKVFSENPNFPLEGVIEVKSPWHAALLLEDINYHFLSKKQRLIFRGQSNSDWNIISSIHRESDEFTADDRLIESVKSQVFADILAALSFNSISTVNVHLQQDEINAQSLLVPKLRVTPRSYIAAAQHYGIPTNLIDWTPDPAVATFFAALAAKKSKCKTASIYVLSVQEVIENNFEILIPPPFIERLHLQRGFFIRADKKNENANTLKDLCFIEIRFPTDFYFDKFEVIRRGLGVVNLLPEYPMAEELKAVADNIARSFFHKVNGTLSYKFMLPQEYNNLIFLSTGKIRAHFNSLYNNYYEFWDDYLLKFEEILFWTCYKELGEDIYLDEQIYQKILYDNHDLAYSVITLWKEYLAEENSRWEKERLDRIKLFVQAADEFVKNFNGFKSVTFQEAWMIKK